jgi:hypothetical protein
VLKSVIKYLELLQQQNFENIKQFTHCEIREAEARIRADLTELKSELRKRNRDGDSLQKQAQM